MKKNEARFTIKFNTANPRHKEAIRMLNGAGRSKASLIADALCMYACYGATECSDLIINSRNNKIISTGINKTQISTKIDETINATESSQLDEDAFWKDVGSSVYSFFD